MHETHIQCGIHDEERRDLIGLALLINMKFIELRGCSLEHTAPVAQKEDTSMSRKKSTPPTPVLASTIEWNTASGPIPAVRLTGLTHTIYVGPNDLPRLEEAVRVARARLDAMQDQAQEVAA